MTASPWPTIAGVAGLLLLVLVVYWPTLDNGFIWDDETYVENNINLRSAAGLYDIWFKIGAVPQYYPLVHTTFWLEYHLWGLAPRGYHLVNLALHATAAIVLWRVLILLRVPGAWLAAAIFAVHPVQVETVAWVTERKNVLSCLLALGSIAAYLRFSPAGSDAGEARSAWGYYALSLVLFILALFSKTVACSVPAVLLVIYWWQRGRIDWREAARLAPFFVVGLALAGLTVWMERTRVLAVGDEWAFSPLDRVLIAGRALWFYAAKLVWPWPLIFFYPRWTIDDARAWQYLYPVAAAAIFVLLWALRKRIGRGPLAAALIFAGVLFPALGFFNVYPFRFSFVADHFQYHASIALIALAAAGLTLALQRIKARWALGLAGSLVLLPLMVIAYSRTPAYRNLETLYLDTIAQNPRCWIAHHNLGLVLVGKGDLNGALGHLQQAVELDPEQSRLRTSLATTLISLKRFDDAAEQLTAALAAKSDDYDRSAAWAYLGSVRSAQQRYDEAFTAFRQALEVMPTNWTALSLLAEAQWERGQRPQAIESLTKCLEIMPQYDRGQHRLGQMLLASGRVGEAAQRFALAVVITPNARYLRDLGIAQFQSGDLLGAERNIKAALAIDPDNAEAHNLLGAILGSRNDHDGAVAEFEAAVRLNPAHPDAAANLQRAREALRQARPQ